MSNSKQKYLSLIRSVSAYPTYRAGIGLMSFLGYLEAVALGLAALFGGMTVMSRSFLAGLGVLLIGGVFAVISFLFVRFCKELALMLADIGDSAIEKNSRAVSADAAYS